MDGIYKIKKETRTLSILLASTAMGTLFISAPMQVQYAFDQGVTLAPSHAFAKGGEGGDSDGDSGEGGDSGDSDGDSGEGGESGDSDGDSGEGGESGDGAADAGESGSDTGDGADSSPDDDGTPDQGRGDR